MEKHFLFDYGTFFQEMKSGANSKYGETASKYEDLFGCQDGLTIQDQPFYKEYLSQFQMPFRVVLPEGMTDDFDWDLLFCLILGSFSSEYFIMLDKEWRNNPKGKPLVHISIKVNLGDKSIIKTLDELWSFQIFRLYEIYVNEQIEFEILKEDEKEKVGVENERKQKFSIFKKMLREVKSDLLSDKLRSTL